MQVDDTAALSEVLREYQQESSDDHAEARLAIALTRVVENSVQPSLMKKLRPQDVDDVCSEIILGFWQFRHSVRPDEVGKLINTLKHRRVTDQVREYYREDDHHAHEPAAGERELLALLPARDGKPDSEAGQDVWELLSGLALSAKDRVIAYMVYLGAEKRVIASVLNVDQDTVTNSVKRCREALQKKGYIKDAGNHDG
jgi:DNA-directed RNA polymerase specialized sigma24 family protein